MKSSLLFQPMWESNLQLPEGIAMNHTSLPIGGITTIPTGSYVPPVGLEGPKTKSPFKGNKSKTNRTFQNNILIPETKAVGMDIEEELNKQDLYKTELCKSWVESGLCRYGEKCQFAHGPTELRPVLRHPKYKTEICKTFHTYGTCPYGKRCRFVHTSPLENNPPKKEVESESGKDKEKESESESGKSVNNVNTVESVNVVKNGSSVNVVESGSAVNVVKNVTVSVEEETVVVGEKKKGSKLPFFQKLHKQSKKKNL